MNRKYILAVVCCIPLMLGAQDAEVWSDYSPPGRQYRVSMPGTPNEQTSQSRDGAVHTATANSTSGRGLTFMVITVEVRNGKNLDRKENGKRFVEGMERGFFQESKGRVINSKAIELGIVQGRESIAEGVFQKKARAICYVYDKWAYQILVLSDDFESLQSEEAERFLSSFQFLDAAGVNSPKTSASYQMGQVIGGAAVTGVAVVGVVVLVFFLTRKKSARPVRRARRSEFDDDF